MPQPLDPTDAMFSAASGFFVRIGCFGAITLGGHCFGLLMYHAPAVLAALAAGGTSMPYVDLNLWSILGSWVGVMIMSFFKLATLPFILFALWSFFRVHWGCELFRPLLFFGLAQPIHTLVALQQFDPLTTGEFWAALALILMIEGIAAALVIWWWNSIQDTPDLPPEPEL
jgi:hypothetical protein